MTTTISRVLAVCPRCGRTVTREDSSSVIGRALIALLEGGTGPAVGHYCPKRQYRLTDCDIRPA